MGSKTWQLQEAKNHFSEVVDLAMKGGAQTVTKHGKPAVVIVSVEEYERARKPKKSLFSALRQCPADLTELVAERIKEPARSIRFD